jgi:uncharacterized protein
MKIRPSRRQVLMLLLLLGVLVMFLHSFEHNQVYHPSSEMDATGAELGRPFENVFFKTSDGVQLNGWFFPATTNSPRASIAVLIYHGNGGNISHRLDIYQALLQTGVAVFAFDYRGYGRSEGRAGEEGTYLDAQAAHQWLARKGFQNIVAYGESLGGGVVAELCLREKVSGLVLQSAFTSIVDIGAELFPWLPVRLISRIQYDIRAKLPRLKIPVLVMHSRVDDLVPFHHAERNFAAANEPKLFCELGGDHNDALDDPALFIQGMEKFLTVMEENRTR